MQYTEIFCDLSHLMLKVNREIWFGRLIIHTFCGSEIPDQIISVGQGQSSSFRQRYTRSTEIKSDRLARGQLRA